MKKLDVKKLLTPQGIGLMLIAAGVIILAGILIAKNNDDNSAVAPPPPSPYKIVNACQVFTLADAKKIIGSTAKKNSGGSNSITKDDNISTCFYSQDPTSVPVSQIQTLKRVIVTVHSPKTAAGKQKNHDAFDKNKPAGSQDVAGYADKAFWIPNIGLLNVLKGDTWVTFSSGTASLSGHTLDDTKKPADIVIPKL
jgi:hypothetical protein